MSKKIIAVLASIAIALSVGIVFYTYTLNSGEVVIEDGRPVFSQNIPSKPTSIIAPRLIPPHDKTDYVELGNGIPNFTQWDMENLVGECYSELDRLGRCGSAYVLLDKSMLPTVERSDIGQIRPSGWHTVKYPEVIEDMYLYNRSHLIAYALTGQNANERNLITGTRYMNSVSMLSYELKVIHYVQKNNSKVLYRVTPYFEGDNLVATGVEIEAYSVDDCGEGLQFHVFVYNYQPGIIIDYRDGTSRVEG